MILLLLAAHLLKKTCSLLTLVERLDSSPIELTIYMRVSFSVRVYVHTFHHICQFSCLWILHPVFERITKFCSYNLCPVLKKFVRFLNYLHTGNREQCQANSCSIRRTPTHFPHAAGLSRTLSILNMINITEVLLRCPGSQSAHATRSVCWVYLLISGQLVVWMKLSHQRSPQMIHLATRRGVCHSNAHQFTKRGPPPVDQH